MTIPPTTPSDGEGDGPRPVRKFLLWAAAAVLAAALAAFGGDVYEWLRDRLTPDGDPVRVDSVTVDISEPGAVFPATFQPNPGDPAWPGDNYQEFGEWAHENGGTGISEGTVVSFRLGGYRDRAVRITGMRVEKECGEPLAGTLFYTPTAGDSGHRELALDLDRSEDFAVEYFSARDVTLTRGEQETFDVPVTSKTYSCSFTIRASILEGDRRSTLVVDDGGKPFTVTPLLPLESYRALYIGGVLSGGRCPEGWSRQDPQTFEQTGCA